MDLKITIADDAELRSHIKSLVKSQVQSIAREDYLKTLEVEVYRKLDKIPDYEFKKMVKESLLAIAKQSFLEHMEASDYSYNNNWIKPYVQSVITEMASRQNWEDRVKRVIAEHLTKLINQ